LVVEELVMLVVFWAVVELTVVVLVGTLVLVGGFLIPVDMSHSALHRLTQKLRHFSFFSATSVWHLSLQSPTHFDKSAVGMDVSIGVVVPVPVAVSLAGAAAI
jgi:hypothetical protein